MCVCAHVLSHFSHVQVFAMLWTVERQTLLSMGFPGQEYWSGLPCRPTRDFPNPGIEPVSLRSPALAGRFFTATATWEALASPLVLAVLSYRDECRDGHGQLAE